MRRIVLALLCAFPVLLSSLTVSAQDGPQYDITNLIKAHDLDSETKGFGAYSITDDGVVVGFTGQSPTKSSPFYTVDGKATRLKGGGEFGASAGDINSAGVVVGRAISGEDDGGNFVGTPVTWVDGKMTQLDLPVDPAGQAAINGVARSINEAGLIVGEAQYPGEANNYVVAWNDGVPSLLPDAYGYPYCGAFGLAESGAIAGQCWEPTSGTFIPVIWNGLSATPLVTMPYPNTILTSITDTAGGYATVGYAFDTAESPAYVNGIVVIDGQTQDLTGPADSPYCHIWSVSETEAGLLTVGGCFADLALFNISSYEGRVAAAWLDGELIDLESAVDAEGWTLLWLRGSNSQGQMVGLGERNGERRSFILTPTG